MGIYINLIIWHFIIDVHVILICVDGFVEFDLGIYQLVIFYFLDLYKKKNFPNTSIDILPSPSSIYESFFILSEFKKNNVSFIQYHVSLFILRNIENPLTLSV